ncbi:ABA4-like family protein [Haliangium sp.]|uniref:ABA4-like family protein n=1 Tax=Haliangium sp. TaxID=2663208 RepID=UPI003D0EDB34
MPTDTLFSLCNAAVLPAWLLLMILPRWRGTRLIVHAIWIPLVFTGLYVLMLATGDTPEGAGFGSLDAVMRLFTVPEAVLAGWIHYLAFDLFVGAWEVRDAGRRGIHHLLVVPCLFFTFMFGPVGLALYSLLRLVLRRTASLDEVAAP